MNENFMKEKPVFPLLMSMALPMVVSMLVSSLYNIVDSLFVARISEDAMTSLSLVYPVQNLVNALGIGYAIAINALIALNLGAGKTKRANTAATLGMFVALIHSVVMGGLAILFMPWFLGMFTQSPTVLDFGIRYSIVVFAFTPMNVLAVSFEKVFQSVGKMKITMTGMMLGCIANIILDPLMIFGIGGFPEMGIEGAALATGLGQTLTFVFYLALYFRGCLSIRIQRDFLVFDRDLFIRLYGVGIPSALSMALPSLLVSALNGILAAFSQIYIVILGIYYKLQTFLYLPANGFVQGMRPLIGFNYGAGEYGRVRKIYSIVLIMSGLIMACGTLLCLVFSAPLIGLFTTNPETIHEGSQALQVISVGFIFSSVSVTSSGALEGLGKGIPSLMISCFRYVLFMIPAAFLLSRLLGPDGVWHAFWLTECLTAAIAFFIYRKNFAEKT